MKAQLRDEIKQARPFRNRETEAYLNLVRTAGALVRDLEGLLKPYGLTATQYNVLRILRGAGKDGLTCSEIGKRMVNDDPDVTRLLDRLEKRGLICRSRSQSDRRIVTTEISPEGMQLVRALDRPLDDRHRRQFECVTKPELANLIAQLERIRTGLNSATDPLDSATPRDAGSAVAPRTRRIFPAARSIIRN